MTGRIDERSRKNCKHLSRLNERGKRGVATGYRIETGSFTRAADKVNKAKSTVSVHIRELELRLGHKLFAKIGRSVRLLPHEERLVEHARRILEAQAAAMTDLAATSLVGRVVFGIPDDYAAAFLVGIVDFLTAHHPKLELMVHCHHSPELADRVRHGEIGLALVTATNAIKDVEILQEDRLHWVAGRYSDAIGVGRPLLVVLPDSSTP